MESSTQAPATDSSARTFSQVVFNDIPHSYPPSTSVTCCYTLTAAFQPNPRDWVGIFKVRKQQQQQQQMCCFLISISLWVLSIFFVQVGWSTTKDYHTFVWVDPSLDVSGQQYVTRQAVFKGKKQFSLWPQDDKVRSCLLCTLPIWCVGSLLNLFLWAAMTQVWSSGSALLTYTLSAFISGAVKSSFPGGFKVGTVGVSSDKAWKRVPSHTPLV